MRISLLAGAGLVAGAAAAYLLRARDRPEDLRGRVVLITGGSRGLGLALAREFGRRGCEISLCARSRDQLWRAQAMLTEEGFTASAFPCDVSSAVEVEELVRSVHERHGRVDIVVNNAGEILVGPVENMTEADFRRAMDTMFWGPLHMTMAALPEMRRRGSGNIVNIASIGGKVAIPHLIPYCCAKFALTALSEGMRTELARDGIRVTTIAPGLLRTGSDVNARFKGNAEQEAAWFSMAASTLVTSMSAELAAARIADAVERGESEVVLSPQAKVLTRLNGAFPGAISDVLTWVNRLLPEATKDNGEAAGIDMIRQQSGVLRFLTASGRKAGEQLNQAAV
ncbi:MAG: SDR family oxidoreductase [Acidobacteria bacterium]|nr:SDR family oxidoreductase [Acidobacteriota bacterium]